MRIFMFLLAVVTTALGAVVRRDGGAESNLLQLVPLSERSNLADYEVLFYEDPGFKGAGWGMTPIPNQPSSPDNAGQFCYFVDPGRVSSLKLVKQRNDRKFSCRFFRTTDACQHNQPALTLDYPAERASLGPELDNQINSAICWWTSPAQDKPTAKHDVVELVPHIRRQEVHETDIFHLVDVFTDPNFSGDVTSYYYRWMIEGRCLNFINSETNPKWSSVRLNAADIVSHCRFYEPQNCVQDGYTFYFDMQQVGGGNSVHDLRLTKDNKGKPWDNRLKSMKCNWGPFSEEPEERSGVTAYPLELYRDSNFTGSAQFYTWDQLDNELCATLSRASVISSTRKNPGKKDYVCRGYATPNCLPLSSSDPSGHGAFVTLDTFSDLGQIGWNDRIWSVKCNVLPNDENPPRATNMEETHALTHVSNK